MQWTSRLPATTPGEKKGRPAWVEALLVYPFGEGGGVGEEGKKSAPTLLCHIFNGGCSLNA